MVSECIDFYLEEGARDVRFRAMDWNGKTHPGQVDEVLLADFAVSPDGETLYFPVIRTGEIIVWSPLE